MAAACPVCASPPGRISEEWGDFLMRICPGCGLEYCDPLIYDRQSYTAAYARQDKQATDVSIGCMRWLEEASDTLDEFPWFLFAAQQHLVRWTKRNLSPGKAILDIGCGGGMLLGALRAAGFSVHGLELASQPVGQLRRRGFDVVQGSVEDAPASWIPDAVTLTDVLEHLPSPVAFLTELHRHFPKAALLLTVPSPRRWTKPFGLTDLADAPPNHLTRWNGQSLTHALTVAGYRNIQVQYPPPTGLELASVSYRGLIAAWRKGCHPAAMVDSGPPSRGIAEEIRVRRVKAMLAAFPAALLSMAGRSALSMVVIAEPDGVPA